MTQRSSRLHRQRQEFPTRASFGRAAFTILELLVGIVIAAVLATLIGVGYIRMTKAAKSAQSMSNIKGLVNADTIYYGDHGEFPVMDSTVPSSITRDRLAITADVLNLEIPEGGVGSWPKRKYQPKWYNCPLAIDSGYAEGVTLGGGVYTGYIYVGGIEDSKMAKTRMGKLLHPGHNADRRNTHPGVLWASILGEFKSGSQRRYECFHYVSLKPYKDFRFSKTELTGQHRGWSDGSVEWVPTAQIKFGGGKDSDRQIDHTLGFFYY